MYWYTQYVLWSNVHVVRSANIVAAADTGRVPSSLIMTSWGKRFPHYWHFVSGTHRSSDVNPNKRLKKQGSGRLIWDAMTLVCRHIGSQE